MTDREYKLIVLLCNICIIGVIFFIISNIVDRINIVNNDIELLRGKIAERNYDIASFRKVLSEIDKYTKINKEYEKAIVPMTSNENLHMYLQNFLSRFEISTLNLYIDDKLYVEDSSAAVDLTANVYGDYNSFYDFLLSIEQQKKLINFEAVDIYADFTGRYNLSFTLRFFMFDDIYDPNFDFNAGFGNGSNRLSIRRADGD